MACFSSMPVDSSLNCEETVIIIFVLLRSNFKMFEWRHNRNNICEQSTGDMFCLCVCARRRKRRDCGCTCRRNGVCVCVCGGGRLWHRSCAHDGMCNHNTYTHISCARAYLDQLSQLTHFLRHAHQRPVYGRQTLVVVDDVVVVAVVVVDTTTKHRWYIHTHVYDTRIYRLVFVS